MSRIRNLVFVQAILFLMVGVVMAHPSPEGLGEILGYPASEILVADATAEERRVLEFPSARERRLVNHAALSGNKLLAAYRVTAKDPETFYPIIISIAKEGAFLTDDVRRLLCDISDSPDKPILKGGRGWFGNIVTPEAEGGVYLGKVKRPSRDIAMSEPQERMAVISVMHSTSLPVDLRVVFMVALEKGRDLKAIPGGDKYFRDFGLLREEDNSASGDWSRRIAQINKLVISGSGFTTVEVCEHSKIIHDKLPEIATNDIVSKPDASEAKAQRYRLLIFVGAVVFVVFLLLYPKKKKL